MDGDAAQDVADRNVDLAGCPGRIGDRDLREAHSPHNAAAEELLTERLLAAQSELDDGQQVMVKLTLPERDEQYAPLLAHPGVLRGVALSGGYIRKEANARLSRLHGVVAFSWALTERLRAQQD